MGRHRSSAPRPGQGTAPAAAARKQSSRHRKQSPARAGMLTTSAAVAVGALAMASGVLGNQYDLDRGEDPVERVQAGGKPDLRGQGESESPSPKESTAADRGEERSKAPESPSSSAPPSETSAAPETSAPESPSTKPSTSKPAAPAPQPEKPKPSTKSPDTTTAAEAAVLSLVNQERAKAGCRPVTADPELAALAGEFSADMAERDFFDHTDPDGDDPWDRAEQAGITGLGGENIARGQANAQSVMDAWMDSPGHKANIVNCEFKTLGVGAHFAEGGPWWTQNFGY